MPKKEKERRQTARIHVLLVGEATYQPRGEEPRSVRVTAQNVSETGAYLAAKTCPAVGDRTEISLRCDSGLQRLKISLEAVGTVTRVDEPGKKQGGFSVEFHTFSDLGKG